MQQAKALFEQGRIEELLAQYRHTQESLAYDPIGHVQEQADDYNASDGNLHLDDGVLCDVCRNKGWTATANGIHFALRACGCMAKRQAVVRMRKSGLHDLLKRYTLDAFTTHTPWHRIMREKADIFLTEDTTWYFTGGQVGCGKTHICTAICAELLKRGIGVRYMLWRDESAKLKAISNEPEYDAAIMRWKTAPVLYIDDLFKAARSDARDKPSGADIRLAFEIINYRYNNLDLRTVISSEWMVEELMSFDEGVGSRVLERIKLCCAEIGRSPDRNYRNTGGAIE